MLIYKITNTITGKPYIGLDRDRDGSKTKRWREHQYNASRDNQYVSKLYRSMKKHGIENFTHEVIHDDITDEYELIKLEAEYIKSHDSISNGYNILPADLMADHSFLSEEDKEAIRLAKSRGAKEANRVRWASVTDDEKKEFFKKLIESYPTEDRKKNVKEYWDSLDASERADRIQGILNYWENITPEQRDKRAVTSRDNFKLGSEKLSGLYKITQPDGSVVEVKSLKSYCIEHSLRQDIMYAIANGNREEGFNGWRVEIIEPPAYKRNNMNVLRGVMISPTGDEVSVDNFKEFCKTNGLHYSAIQMLKAGKIKQTKGWKLKEWWKVT